MIPGIVVRRLVPADRDAVIAEMRAWSPRIDLDVLLPPEIFQNSETSLLAADEDEVIVGFVLALRSHREPETGFVHFVWVSPACRGRGLASQLYLQVMATFRASGCTRVEGVTSPRNAGAVGFHRHMGFTISEPTTITAPGPDQPSPQRELVTMSRPL